MAAAALLLGSSAALATPTFLTPINLSDAGQDAYDAEVAQDSSGNSLTIWNRFDGSNFRIQVKPRDANGTLGPTTTISLAGRDAFEPQVQFDPSGNAIAVWTQWDGGHSRIHAAFRPAGGSFGGDQTLSAGGMDASAPQIAIDSAGKAMAVWYALEGAVDRVQTAVRPANGSFGAPQTLSAPGVESYEPQGAAGPNVDANGVVVWTGTDGTNLRIQSARRKDVVGYPRPKGATPLRVPLVPAYNPCTAPNRTHGPGLEFPSCNPPVRSSAVLTVGTPDANGFPANSVSSLRWNVVAGDPSTAANEADVQVKVTVDDVRNHPAGSDYSGRLGITSNLRITDQRNSAEEPEPGTSQALPLAWSVQCAVTVDTSRGGTCTVTTTLNVLFPGAVLETKRTIWDLGQALVKDAGPNGAGYGACPPTCGDGDETVFMRQGIFIP